MVKGRRNKVLKLTPAKVKYIIRAKTNNISSRIIAAEMKVSIRTVNRVWGYWMKNKGPLAPKKFGRPKTHLNLRTKKKKKRRKPWIRYERKHSLTAVHLDWHASRINFKEVCMVLDDSSRFIQETL